MKLFLLALLVFICGQVGHAQNRCNGCFLPNEILNEPCFGCSYNADETLLIYDAKCKKFYYKNRGGSKLEYLYDVNKLKINYKKPFRIKLINFNRYLYNVNIGNSDISFTSTESPVMQQYLIPGATNGQITPYNSYTNGGSQNGGDYVFSVISSFKANVDLLLSKIDYTTTFKYNNQFVKKINSKLNDLTIVAQQKYDAIKSTRNQRIKVLQESLTKTSPKHPGKIKAIQNEIKDSVANSKKDSTVFNTIRNFQANLNLFVSKLDSIKPRRDHPSLLPDSLHIMAKKITENAASASPLMHELKLDTSFQNLNSTLNDSVAETSKKDTILTSTSFDDSIYNRDIILKNNILALEKYYDRFIDNKISAYSLCTKTLPCCKDSPLTYSYFDSVLNDVSIAFYKLKLAIKIKEINQAKDSSEAGKKQQDDKPAFTSLKVSASDIIVENGLITGIKIHQALDTTKAKKDKAGIDSVFGTIDSLWFSLEKTISADYIMRQILFNNNMIAENMSYTSPPIYPYGNRLGLLMQISPSDSVKKMGTMPTNSESVSLDFAVRKKPLFSFSGGTFAGFGNQVKSPVYEFQQVPVQGSNMVQANSPYQLKQTSSGSTPIGFDGLANLTFFVSPDLRLGFSAGVGAVVTPTPVQVAYLFGGTISAGTYQQFHLTAGYMGISVNQLNQDLAANINGPITYATAPSVGYKQGIEGGLFVSLSYTLFTISASGTAPNSITNNKSQ